MGIHQIQVRYDELQDRLVLRMSTTDECEFRFWLTRRFVKRLWGALVRLLEQNEVVRQQIDEYVRRAVLGMQHEGFVQQGDFSKEFEERPCRMPLGEEPVLLARCDGGQLEDGSYVLRLHPKRGQGIDMALDARLLHLVCKLLCDGVTRADWDMKLLVAPAIGETTAAEALAPRRVH